MAHHEQRIGALTLCIKPQGSAFGNFFFMAQTHGW
jgi:hypothetical protein